MSIRVKRSCQALRVGGCRTGRFVTLGPRGADAPRVRKKERNKQTNKQRNKEIKRQRKKETNKETNKLTNKKT